MSPDNALSHEMRLYSLEDGFATRLEHATAFVDQPLRIGRVLHDAVRVDQVECPVRKRQPFAVGDPEIGREPLLLEVGLRERRWRTRTRPLR